MKAVSVVQVTWFEHGEDGQFVSQFRTQNFAVSRKGLIAIIGKTVPKVEDYVGSIVSEYGEALGAPDLYADDLSKTEGEVSFRHNKNQLWEARRNFKILPALAIGDRLFRLEDFEDGVLSIKVEDSRA